MLKSAVSSSLFSSSIIPLLLASLSALLASLRLSLTSSALLHAARAYKSNKLNNRIRNIRAALLPFSIKSPLLHHCCKAFQLIINNLSACVFVTNMQYFSFFAMNWLKNIFAAYGDMQSLVCGSNMKKELAIASSFCQKGKLD